MRIVLADLGHNLLTFSSDIYPLGVANLVTYARAYLDSPVEHDFHIVREPQDLEKLLDEGGVDVLGVSSYAWNHELARTAARYAKAKDEKTLTLLGGPHWPLVESVQAEFLQEMPEIDVAVRGPTYEGERAFLNIIQRYIEVGKSIDGLRETPVPGNAWFDRKKDEFVPASELPRIEDLDEIPSPYTEGWMDPFFDTGYFPMMQIARGCPFSCQFCNSAVKDNSRIYAHSVENVKADLDYIAARIKPEITLCMADDNFGMYQRDEEIADYIGHLQEKHGWPRYIRTTTGKNRPERIIKVMRSANGALPMTSAVQSMNPVVLKNIKRSNIKLSTYSEVQKELERQGMQSYGELILCMPGETKASFMDAVDQLLESGVKRVSAHQLMLLHGAPLANPDQREKFGLETRFRVVARNIGYYFGNQPVIETEEMVVCTPEFSFQDYLDARVFHLLLTTFYYEGNFDEAFQFARAEGIRPFDLVVHLHSILDRADPAFRKVVDDFVQESQEELHDTREGCDKWSREHLQELIDGTLGGNLLSKYSMILRFYTRSEGIAYLAEAIRDMLKDPDEALLEQLQTIVDFLDAVMLGAPFKDALANRPEWEAEYDVGRWVEDGYKKPLTEYRLDDRTRFAAHVPQDRAALISTKIDTFGEHPQGLGKFTRTMFARDMRREVERAS